MQPEHDESLLTPWGLEATLDNLPRHAGQKMVVREPLRRVVEVFLPPGLCVYISCKGCAFRRDAMASPGAALNSLSADTIFQHACVCATGGPADTFALYRLVMQIHQTEHAFLHEKAVHGLVHFLNVAEHFRTSVGC